jgi:hypothetical protein
MSRLRKALPALVVAGAGVLLAWLWATSTVYLSVGGLLVVLAGGVVSAVLGRYSLPDKPTRAGTLLEWSVLIDVALGIAAAGLIVWLGVWLEPSSEASLETKKMLAAGFGALSAFLTTTFIKGAEDPDEGWVGGRVEKAFGVAYVGRFRPGSTPWRALKEPEFAGESRWGKVARRTRARMIEESLGGPDDKAPNPAKGVASSL